MARLCLISDTHELHEAVKIPEGDILVHAGDMTLEGSPAAISSFGHWLHKQIFPFKICIAGNHDILFQRSPDKARRILQEACPEVLYLEDTDVEVMGLKFYGSPWTPTFDIGWAFNYPRGYLKEKWSKIPYGLDVLVTHGPPAGDLGGRLPGFGDRRGEDVGDGELRNAIMEKKPRLHVCGHIHEGRGERNYEGMKFVNASICAIGRSGYYPRNSPVVVDLTSMA